MGRTKLRLRLAAAQAAHAGWCWTTSIAVDAALRPLYITPAASPMDLKRRLLPSNRVHAGSP